MNNYCGVTKAVSKAEMARRAAKRGQLRFKTYCKVCDKTTLHYVSNAACLSCKAKRDAATEARKTADLEFRARINAVSREWMTERRATDPLFKGAQTANTVMKHWLNPRDPSRLTEGHTQRQLPAWFEHERKAINEFYSNCPEGYEVDHLTPINGIGVTGLHCLSNLTYLPTKVNRMKKNHFDTEQYRSQRPLNGFSGGAEDPVKSGRDEEIEETLWAIINGMQKEALRIEDKELLFQALDLAYEMNPKFF